MPFRRRNRVGVVVDLLAEPDVEKTLPIRETLGPGLDPADVSMCRWIAGRTLSTLGEALAAAVPERVASEEQHREAASRKAPALGLEWLRSYRSGASLARAVGRGGGFLWRPGANEARGRAIAALAGAALTRGRGAIVLLPEVRVSGEVASVLSKTFGDAAAWLGSERPARVRYRDWLALRTGRKRLAVGGRGAVLAPVRDLGLVVIDDEAHVSYKERRAPRFHARAVAAERARRAGATLVLVGTPPSVEARAAAERGALTLVAPSRADELRRRPPVTVIDRAREPERLVPSARTLALAREALRRGERVVVLVHRAREARVGDRTRRNLPTQRPARLDARSSSTEIERAAAGADLIVATPVIAKDLALEGIGLVAIVEADAALSVPEFRAAEEAFATWWHAGRFPAPRGAVAIETHDPRHPAIVALARWDPDVLYRAEAARRSELGYPPYAALARIETAAERSEALMAELSGTGLTVLGPVEHGGRAVFVLRAPGRDALLEPLRPLARAWREAGAPVRVDVDPREVLPQP